MSKPAPQRDQYRWLRLPSIEHWPVNDRP